MVSFISLAVLAFSATSAVAYPKVHGAHYGHKRFHGTGMQGTGYGYANPTGGHHHHHHNGTYNGTTTDITSTLWITVTVYPVDATTAATTTDALTTKNKGVCNGAAATQTITSTSVFYVTVTPEESSTTASNTTTTVSYAPSTLLTSTVAATTSSSSEVTSVTADPVYTSTASAAVVTTSSVTSAAAQFYGGSTSQTVSQTPSTTISGGGYSGSKKGISFTDAAGLDMFGGSGSSWAYNWGLSPANGVSMPSGVEFVPMCWGQNGGGDCAAAVQDAVSKYGSKTVLSFNEPDLGAQSNMSPQDAYTSHVNNIAKPLAGAVKIGSPAVTNSGDTGKGLDWMKSFLQLCKPDPNGEDSCKLDFLALHWYAPASSLDYFKSHVTEAIQLANQYGIPGVWITEFAATDCTDAEQAAFLSQAMTWLESSDAAKVERYAYFMAGYHSAGLGMITNNALNAIGLAYNAVAP